MGPFFGKIIEKIIFKPSINWKRSNFPNTMFDETLNFERLIRFFVKISISEEKFDFSSKFRFPKKNSILEQKFDFRSTFGFSNKISILEQKFDFRSKFRFGNKIRFMVKISIFEEKFDFWTTFRFSKKNSIFEEKFDFRRKIRFSKENSIFGQNFEFRKKIVNNFPNKMLPLFYIIKLQSNRHRPTKVPHKRKIVPKFFSFSPVAKNGQLVGTYPSKMCLIGRVFRVSDIFLVRTEIIIGAHFCLIVI